MKWLLGGLLLFLIAVLGYFWILFRGPHMRVQQHILAYQWSAPLPPKGMVPVDRDPYAVPEAGPAESMKNPVPDTESSRERGKVYYGYYCLACHGPNGQGDGPVGYSYMPAPADLHDPNQIAGSDGALLRAMLLGPGHEPVLARVVPPEHRWYLVNYIRQLNRAPRQPAYNPGALVPKS